MTNTTQNSTKTLFECYICFDGVTDAVMCPECRYLGCRTCLDEWFETRIENGKTSSCPQCQRALDLDTVVECPELNEYYYTHRKVRLEDDLLATQFHNDVLEDLQNKYWENSDRIRDSPNEIQVQIRHDDDVEIAGGNFVDADSDYLSSDSEDCTFELTSDAEKCSDSSDSYSSESEFDMYE